MCSNSPEAILEQGNNTFGPKFLGTSFPNSSAELLSDIKSTLYPLFSIDFAVLLPIAPILIPLGISTSSQK